MRTAPAPAAALAVLAALLPLLALSPPETRGLATLGAAALLALGGVTSLRSLGPAAAACLLAAAAWPLLIASEAPGAAPAALALPLLAIAAAATGAAAGPGVERIVPALLAGTGAVAGLHALWQVTFGLDLAARALESLPGGDPTVGLAIARLREGRAFASFATPAALGGFLAIAIAVTLGAAREAHGRFRVALLAAAAVQTAGLAATQSATALGSIVAAGTLLALRHGGLRRRLLPALLVLLALLAAVLVVRRDRLLDPDAPQSSWGLRAENAAAALRMVEAHPLLGVGPGAFAEVYPSVMRAGNEVRHAHMLPLELAAELGLPLGLLATAVFGWIFLGPLLRRDAPDPGWRAGAAVGLAAFAIQNLADFTAFFPSILWIACLLRGALSRETESAPAWVRLPASLAFVMAAVVMAGSGLSADARRAAGEDLERDLRLADRAVHLAPWEPDARLLRGAVLLRKGEPAAALAETERALRLAPVRPSAHAQRARIRAMAGDLPGAWADLAQAAALFPMRSVYAKEAEALRGRLDALYGRRE